MDKIEEITPPREGKNGAWRGIKNKRTRILNKIKSISVIHEELLGPYQPERLNSEDADNSVCDSLNNANT